MPTLSGWEQAALSIVRRRGLVGFVAIASAVAIISSLLLCTIGLAIWGGFDESRFWRTAYTMSAVIPALVAPPVTYLLARLVCQLADMSEQMRQLAITDPLTGVSNRRGLFDLAAATVAEHAHTRCVAIFDIDEFKTLNDAHGHPTGDDALRHLAEWLTDLVGSDGHVARFGGDEFVVVGAPDRLDEIPRRLEFSVGSASFSVSVGRAGWIHGDDLDRALAYADDDLYKSKFD